MDALLISRDGLTLEQLRAISEGPVTVSIAEECRADMQRSADAVARVAREGRTVYGINTGFGRLANTKIPHDALEMLQKSIVLSHAAGIGALMPAHTVRLLMVLKIQSLSRGYSGVRPELVDRLVALVNRQVYPLIPCKGSVGASGDLAPLAHMSTLLLGEGEALAGGERVPAAEALRIAGIDPVPLAPKEGLALLNGTQASTAYALEGLFQAENALSSAILIGAMSVEAAMGSRVPFDERIHRVRGHAAQIDVARRYREILEDSEIAHAHEDCEKVQDPYSLRCQPQVMGACLQQIRNAAEVLVTEANGVSDNPLVFADDGAFLSGGNFHAEPVAMAADMLAIALSEIGALSERRTALLIDSALSGLPPFIVENEGVNSGFMVAQVTAAALASENKTLAHPASVDSLPTSANQEDHVSMATFAARRLADIYENVEGILAIEWLAAAQGLDFRDFTPGKGTLAAKGAVREVVEFLDEDRPLFTDHNAVLEIMKARKPLQAVETAIGELARY